MAPIHHRWLRGVCAVLLLWGVWLAAPMPPAFPDPSICRAPISNGPDGVPTAPHDHCDLCQIAAPALPPPMLALPALGLCGAVSLPSIRAGRAPGLAPRHPYASRAPPRLV